MTPQEAELEFEKRQAEILSIMFGPEDDDDDWPRDQDIQRWELEDALGICHECGERGACAYDAQGLPLIHARPIKEQDVI